MVSTRNLKLTVAYDGTCYHGFQWQENALSIQQILEEGLSKIFDGQVKLTGAARTDAGVHACGQVVSFGTAGTIPTGRIVPACQGVLPPDIVVLKAEEVPPGFNARRSAQSKGYRYRLLNKKIPDPLERNYSWHYGRHKVDVEKLNTAMQIIVGKHDFSSFRATGGAPVNPVKTIFSAACLRNDDFILFEFWGTGFLYRMVRNLVGTLIKTDRENLSVGECIEKLGKILAAKNRQAAGMTAPPHGLYLMEVKY